MDYGQPGNPWSEYVREQGSATPIAEYERACYLNDLFDLYGIDFGDVILELDELESSMSELWINSYKELLLAGIGE